MAIRNPNVGPVVDSDYPNLSSALAATPVGGTLEIRGTYSITTPFVINKACRVQFVRGAQITATTGHAIDITASGVILDRPKLIGSGSGTVGTSCGIRAIANVADPISDLTLLTPNISNFNKYGIYLEHVRDFCIDRPAINSIAYGGIMMLSCTDGEISGGAIRNLTMPTGFVNAYGIAITSNSAQTLAAAPRSKRITVNRVLVENVPWEGIDTHGGIDLTITNNIVRGCLNGIALVSVNNSDDIPGKGPQRCVVANNNIDSLVTDGSMQDGIKLVGQGAVAGSPIDLSVGCVISNNTVIGHGLEASGAGSGGITIYCTAGAVISNNNIINSGLRGIHIYHSNYGAVVSNNTITDSWTNGGAASAAIQVRSTFNTVNLIGNRAVRGPKTATLVNDRGLWVNSATDNVISDLGNNFDECTTPVADTGNSSLMQIRAKKLGFYGVTPVVRPASPGVAAGTDAAVINAIITALRSQGLVT